MSLKIKIFRAAFKASVGYMILVSIGVYGYNDIFDHFTRKHQSIYFFFIISGFTTFFLCLVVLYLGVRNAARLKGRISERLGGRISLIGGIIFAVSCLLCSVFELDVDENISPLWRNLIISTGVLGFSAGVMLGISGFLTKTLSSLLAYGNDSTPKSDASPF